MEAQFEVWENFDIRNLKPDTKHSILQNRPCFGLEIGHDFFKRVFRKIGDQQFQNYNTETSKNNAKNNESGSLKIEKVLFSDTKFLKNSIKNTYSLKLKNKRYKIYFEAKISLHIVSKYDKNGFFTFVFQR